MLRGLIGASLACTLALCWIVRRAEAQPPKAERGRLLRLLERRPDGMSRDRWLKQRREAARELGRLRERRAVKPLLRIIAKERFDVILEIAIEALGNIGDRRAIKPLRKLRDDPSLDAYVRDAVDSALAKLRARRRTSPEPVLQPAKKPHKTPSRRASGRTAKSRSESHPPKASKAEAAAKPESKPRPAAGFDRLPPIELPELADSVISRGSRLDLVVGAADVQWDGAADRASAGFAVGSHYRRQSENTRYGYTIDGAADVRFGLQDPPGAANTSWGLGHSLQVNPEARYYPFAQDLPQLFGQLSGGAGYSLGVTDLPVGGGKVFNFGAQLAIGGALGYGRIYDIGSRLRLYRIAWVLHKAGVLRARIDKATGRRLMVLWYRLRNQIGSFPQLGYTLRLLREAGLLAGEVDAATAYHLIRILDDQQLLQRRQGMMFRAGYGYARTLVKRGVDRNIGFAYATAEVVRQLGTTREFGGRLRFFYDHLGNTYGLTGSAAYRMFFYNRWLDPLGALGARIDAGISDQPGSSFANGGIGYRVLGGLEYTRFFTRGTRIIASARGGVDHRGALLLLTIEARYGITYGSFAVR